jgi:DNA-binding response OmpR family regulator
MENDRVSPAEKSPSAQARSGANPPRRILVVDDDEIIRQSNERMLMYFGYEVHAVADGADAWEALNADCYDLLITDNNMPMLTGVDLLKKLRAARIALPVIMATRAVPKEEFILFPWLQPDATLIKPYSVTELLDTVREVLRVTDSSSEPVQIRAKQPSAVGWRT